LDCQIKCSRLYRTHFKLISSIVSSSFDRQVPDRTVISLWFSVSSWLAGCFQVDILPIHAQYCGYMITQNTRERLELLQGTLDLLILRTLIFGSQHGQGVARAIQQTSQEELLVDHGALYPALQRLEERGWISAKWGVSSNNRKARFYSLTAAGRKQLVKETNKWERMTGAIARILGAEDAKG